MCLTPKQSQSQRMTEYFKLRGIYSPIYEGTILLKYLLQDLSPTSLFPPSLFLFNSLERTRAHTPASTNYPWSKNLTSLTQQLRSAVNSFNGGTETDFKKLQTFRKSSGAARCFPTTVPLHLTYQPPNHIHTQLYAGYPTEKAKEGTDSQDRCMSLSLNWSLQNREKLKLLSKIRFSVFHSPFFLEPLGCWFINTINAGKH